MPGETQDLLIVTDEGDFLRKQALRMIYALQNVYPEYTAEVRRFSDHRYIPELINFSSKKLVFLTWGYDTYQKLYTTKFLKSSTVQSNNDRLMLTLAKDLDGKPIDILDVYFGEFNEKNRMTVNNIRLVDTWWPQMVAFLFDITDSQLCKPKWEYHTRIIAESKPVKCVDVVNTCMDYFHVKINSQPVPGYRGCNVVLCSGNFPQDESNNCVYLSDSYMATEATPNQYNKEHWLAGLLKIFAKIGVVRKPLKESVVDCTKRSLDICTCGLMPCANRCSHTCPSRMSYCGGICWEKLKSGIKILSIMWGIQLFFMFGSIVAVAVGTGLLFDYSGYMFMGSALGGFLLALCILVEILYLVGIVLCCGGNVCNDITEPNIYTYVATVCNLLAGLLCLVGMVIIWQLSYDDELCLEACDTNNLPMLFYAFVGIPVHCLIWIPCTCCLCS